MKFHLFARKKMWQLLFKTIYCVILIIFSTEINIILKTEMGTRKIHKLHLKRSFIRVQSYYHTMFDIKSLD